MIETLYVDNFRCLVNFRLNLTARQLWLGANGTGKSSVVDLLCKLQRVFDGDSVGDVFSINDLTLWQKKDTQTIGITTVDGENRYEYQLTIECDRRQPRCRIQREQLKWNGEMFFLFDEGDAHLYRVNWHTKRAEEGARVSVDWSRSMIPSVAERDDNWPLIQFRQSVSKWLLVHPIPVLVEDLATGEARRLLPYAQNFAQWYRHMLQENPGIAHEASDQLKQVLPGFELLSLPEFGDSRKLTATFHIPGQSHAISFHDLSDGQRQLVVLYVILYSLKYSHSVLLIDEPDNFVSLREIEPWLRGLEDICHEGSNRQVIVISHHPEVINRMVDGTEVFFYRPDGGHTLTKGFPCTEGLTAAETVARGWDDE